MDEGRKPCEPGRLRMPAQLIRGFDRDTPPKPLDLVGEAHRRTDRQAARSCEPVPAWPTRPEHRPGSAYPDRCATAEAAQAAVVPAGRIPNCPTRSRQGATTPPAGLACPGQGDPWCRHRTAYHGNGSRRGLSDRCGRPRAPQSKARDIVSRGAQRADPGSLRCPAPDLAATLRAARRQRRSLPGIQARSGSRPDDASRSDLSYRTRRDGRLHAELSSYSGQSLGIDFHRPLGEPPICPVKQEQHGEPEAVPAIFDHNERVICRGQRPALLGCFPIRRLRRLQFLPTLRHDHNSCRPFKIGRV